MEKNTNQVNKSKVFAILFFVLFLVSTMIPPINEFFSFYWHKLAYVFFGSSFYFPFWFFAINQIILPPFLIGLFAVLILNPKRFPKTIVYLICLLAVFLIGIIKYHKDFKNMLNDNYIVKKVSVYDVEKRRGKGSRGLIMPRYRLAAYGSRAEDTFFGEIDIIGYRKILEHKKKLRQEFMLENPYDPYQDVTDMTEYEFDNYIESSRGYRFGEWQDKMELTIYYLPDSEFIFKYEIGKK
jgi:hypothetical protein